MKLQIKEPCHENWDKMRLGMQSRHCEVCVKNVQDFTNKSRYEILDYLLSQEKGSVCGRIQKAQLDFHQEELLVIIEELRFKKGNRPFAILAMATLALVACNPTTPNVIDVKNPINPIENPIVNSIEKDTTEIIKMGEVGVSTVQDSVKTSCNSFKKDSIINGNFTKGKMSIEPTEVIELLGELMIYEPKDTNSIFTYTDKMPEFPGGIDSMFSFLRNNTKYPAKAKKDSIEGRIFVQFVVEKDGSVINKKILRGLIKELDEEVLRVMDLMPNWIPGEDKGRKVAVKMSLPFKFTLKK